MNGLLLALVSAFSFACVNILIRRGMLRTGESYTGVVISLFVGTLIFGLWVYFSGLRVEMESLSWLGVGSLALAGIVHFVMGRSFAFNAIRLMGSSRAVPVVSSHILIAALLGTAFLGEPVTLPLVLALILVVGGIVILSRQAGGRGADTPTLSEHSRGRGMAFALGTVVCWGVSPVLIKFGLQELGSAALATFVSGLAATVVIGLTLFLPENRYRMRRLDRIALATFVLAALAATGVVNL